MNDFPQINHDELIYSIIGRYHKTDGNNNIKDTFKDFFSSTSITPIVQLTCLLERLCSNLPKELGYSSDYFIKNCTLFPFYAPFMSFESRQKCIETMKLKNGSGLKTRMGIVAGGICRKNNIFYCPECIKEEVKSLTGPYIHRLHQVEGIFICEKHKCKLKEYGQRVQSKAQVICLDINNIDFKDEYFNDKDIEDKLLSLAKEVKYLLQNDISSFLNRAIVNEKYYNILSEKGYLTVSGNVKQRKLGQDFINYYGHDFLEILESYIDIRNENNWLKAMLRKAYCIVHPIRNILLIDFLCENIGEFVEYKAQETRGYPCLNKFCTSYKVGSDTVYKITADYKTREPVITVTCNECGFVYSRKNSSDIYKIGKVKDYGFLWLSKLESLLTANTNNSLRELSRVMHCDPKTVVKYAYKLGCSNSIQSKMNINSKVNIHSSNNNRVQYRKCIKEILRRNPTFSISEIKQYKYKEYMWLYKNDKDWLKSVGTNLIQPVKSVQSRVNWDQRDMKLVDLLRTAYQYLKSNEPEKRVTKTLLGRKCGKLSYIEKRLSKLPLSKEYLGSVQESVEEFQIRRVNTICINLHNKGEEIVEWKVRKMAGLKENSSDKVLGAIKISLEL